MQRHLAWHETLEIHELVAFQANGLIGLKQHIKLVADERLRGLYQEAIQGTEQNLRELLVFYRSVPTADDRAEPVMEAYLASHLLIFAKVAVRNYAIAITETATPDVREVLKIQLYRAIELHAKAFYYNYERGLYPAYNLQQLLANDVNLAQRAISME